MRTLFLTLLLMVITVGCAGTKSHFQVTAQVEQNKPAAASAAWVFDR